MYATAAVSAETRPFEITVGSKVVTEGVVMRFDAHLVPKELDCESGPSGGPCDESLQRADGK
jgi:hypothetical protein